MVSATPRKMSVDFNKIIGSILYSQIFYALYKLGFDQLDLTRMVNEAVAEDVIILI